MLIRWLKGRFRKRADPYHKFFQEADQRWLYYCMTLGIKDHQRKLYSNSFLYLTLGIWFLAIAITFIVMLSFGGYTSATKVGKGGFELTAGTVQLMASYVVAQSISLFAFRQHRALLMRIDLFEHHRVRIANKLAAYALAKGGVLAQNTDTQNEFEVPMRLPLELKALLISGFLNADGKVNIPMPEDKSEDKSGQSGSFKPTLTDA